MRAPVNQGKQKAVTTPGTPATLNQSVGQPVNPGQSLATPPVAQQPLARSGSKRAQRQYSPPPERDTKQSRNVNYDDSLEMDVEKVDDALDTAKKYLEYEKTNLNQSKNVHVKAAASFVGKTLCLASPINVGDDSSALSFFAERDTLAGTYSRSMKHYRTVAHSGKDAQKEVMGMVVKDIPKKDAANFGAIPNAMTLELRQMKGVTLSEDTAQKKMMTTPANGTGLYNESLNYRVDTTKHVEKELEKSKHFKALALNEYPALMVHFKAEDFLGAKFPRDGASSENSNRVEIAKEDFNKFLMRHYAGIVNAEAAKMGLETPTVERSSFGHTTPSVAVTAESFRINLGTMPPEYAEAHVRALRTLDGELQKFKETINSSRSVNLAEFGQLAKSENATELSNSGNIMTMAFTRAEKNGERDGKPIDNGKCLITNAMRSMATRDYVDVNSYQRHLSDDHKPSEHGEIYDALKDLFGKTRFKDDGSEMSTKVASPQRGYDMAPTAQEAREAAKEVAPTSPGSSRSMMDVDTTSIDLHQSYDKYLGNFREKFEHIALTEKNADVQANMMAVARTLHSENPKIGRSLDMANQLLLMHTIKKIERVGADDMQSDINRGSDSEIDDKEHGIFGRKIIVHNGMRALLTSVREANERYPEANAKEKLRITYDNPYYETQGSVKMMFPGRGAVKEDRDPEEAKLVVKDINACVTNGDLSGRGNQAIAEQFPDAKVWIMDSTSANSARMHNIYKQFSVAKNAELLIFASSGLKNENPDINPYGTVRVFGKHVTPEVGEDKSAREVVGEIIEGIEGSDKGLAKFSHEYRRTMKKMGFVPTNHSIVMGMDAPQFGAQ